MAWLRVLLIDVGDIAWGNRGWMTWNTVLALTPLALAVPLFRYQGRRGLLWGTGVVAFVLLLPNAPYVLTDLVHLRGDVAQTSSDAAVYAGVLPLYAAFIAVGFAAYALSLHEVGGFLARSGRAHRVGPTELALHALCAVGVLLGRVARLNSWDTIVEPDSTISRALDTLTWRGSPVVLLVLFAAIWIGHATIRVLGRAAATWVGGHLGPDLRSAAP